MFELKSYTRKELALLYFPTCTPGGAYQNLRRRLIEKPESENLISNTKGKQILTRVEVKQIVDILGEP